MLASRRDWLRAALALQVLALAPVGCRRDRPVREDGRVVVTFWYAYGDLVRKVLLDLVARYNASQSRVLVKAVHQGDYFEALAKLRTAIAAGAAPTLSHVVVEVLPYLAAAGVLEPLDGYEGATALALVPALAQRGVVRGADAQAALRRPVQPLDADRLRQRTPARARARRARRARGRSSSTPRAPDRRTRGGDATRWGFEVPISWWFWVALVGQAGGRVVEPDGRVSLGGEAGETRASLLAAPRPRRPRDAPAARAATTRRGSRPTRASSRGASP